LQTLHLGVAYFQLGDVHAASPEALQAVLAGKLGAEAATAAFSSGYSIWQEVQQLQQQQNGQPASGEVLASGGVDAKEGGTDAKPKFYILCKDKAGGQEFTTRFRQALAATVASITGWEPVIKNADITITVSFRDDWALIGILLPPAKAQPQVAAAASDSSKALAKRMFSISKEMTNLLRHTAVKKGVAIRSDGYCLVEDVLAIPQLKKWKATVEDVKVVVRDSDKRRFELAEVDGHTRIRAVQGHSIAVVNDNELLVQLKATDQDLPQVCVHGTYRRHLAGILKEGLLAGGPQRCRRHVHFAPFEPGDDRVISGMRYNCEVAVYLDARRALEGGVPIFRSSNDVLLTIGIDGAVPAKYIDRVWDLQAKSWIDLATFAATQPTATTATADDGSK